MPPARSRMGPVKAEAERAAHPQAENRAVSRAAHRDATEDRMSGVRSRKAAQADQRPINTEANITEQPCRSRSRHHTSDNPRITPELSRPAKRVRLGRTVMRAKVNPKPATRNGSGGAGGTEEASARTEQVEASKDRSRERRQSVSHEAIRCRVARTRCVRSLLKRSRDMKVIETSQRPINAEASDAAEVDALPKPTTPTYPPTHNT